MLLSGVFRNKDIMFKAGRRREVLGS